MGSCHIDVVKVTVLDEYVLHLQFADGNEGDVDISQLVSFTGIFEPLRDKVFFSKVCVDPEIGTICWENGADLSPSYLYQNLK